jgi:hypothetical protein
MVEAIKRNVAVKAVWLCEGLTAAKALCHREVVGIEDMWWA